MPQLKDFLAQQLTVPLGIEASLPQGAPKVSGILSQIAANLPQTPDLPIGGAGGAGMQGFAPFGAGLPMPTGFQNVIQGFEGNLPQGFPALSQFGLSGFRSMETEKAQEKAVKQPTLGGGYRSIST